MMIIWLLSAERKFRLKSSYKNSHFSILYNNMLRNRSCNFHCHLGSYIVYFRKYWCSPKYFKLQTLPVAIKRGRGWDKEDLPMTFFFNVYNNYIYVYCTYNVNVLNFVFSWPSCKSVVKKLHFLLLKKWTILLNVHL